MTEEELKQLQEQARTDRKLIQRAADALAEIDRNDGLVDRHADVLTELRIRLEGKARASLEDLMTVTGDISGKKDLGDILKPDEQKSVEWPEVEEKKLDWPGA